MRFRQNSILFWEGQIFISICLIVGLVLMVFDRKCVSILLFPLVLLLAVFILQFVLQKEYIIMDETGVSCQRGKQLLWEYKWTEIASLKISNRFRNPSIDIVPNTASYSCEGNIETIEAYFQLGLTAKKAIKNYCKCPVIGMQHRK